MDDDELIAAMARGDDTALREVFARHAPWLAARLRPILPAAEVEDVLQESFLAVWRGRAATGPRALRAAGCGGSPGGRLMATARNGPGPAPEPATGPACAAARRLAALPAAARHAWLATHLPELRAGRLTLGELP